MEEVPFEVPFSESVYSFNWDDLDGKTLVIGVGRDELTSKKVIGGFDPETGNIYVLLEVEE